MKIEETDFLVMSWKRISTTKVYRYNSLELNFYIFAQPTLGDVTLGVGQTYDRLMKDFFRKYFEVLAFSTGLLLLALMDPEASNGFSLCLFDLIGIPFCPGDGLGHSVSYFFRGQIDNALGANILGPFAIFIIGGRSAHLLWKNHKY